MTQNVDMVEGVECWPKEFGLSPIHWVVRKGTRPENQYLHQLAHPFHTDHHPLTQFRRYGREATANHRRACRP